MGDPVAGDEEVAYWVGLCSQFAALGQVSVYSLPGAALQSADRAIGESSAAALNVRGQLAGLFT